MWCMYRKRYAVPALLMALVLTGCAAQTASQPKLLQEEVKTASANLKVVPVQKGDLQREFSSQVNVAYADTTTVRLQADDALYVEHTVNNGDKVQAGDVIAIFRKRSDDVRLTAIALELKELEAQREDGLKDRAEQMEDLMELMEDVAPDMNGYNDARSNAQLHIYALEMKKMQLEQEQFLLQLAEQERKLKKERQELKEAEEDLTVTAPVDGVIDSIAYMIPGSQCVRGQAVATIRNPESVMMVAATGTLGEFRVGQEVSVSYGRRNARLSTTGRVVAADNLLDETHKMGYSVIKLNEDIPVDQLGNSNATALRMDVKDVLILPRDAVQHEGGRSYVEVVTGTTASVRYVLSGLSDGDNVMILAGLEENTSVIDK